MTENTLNEEHFDLWIAALESGEYKQGHGVLTETIDLADGGTQDYDCCLNDGDDDACIEAHDFHQIAAVLRENKHRLVAR